LLPKRFSFWPSQTIQVSALLGYLCGQKTKTLSQQWRFVLVYLQFTYLFFSMGPGGAGGGMN
jgi:hypothetical protein